MAQRAGISVKALQNFESGRTWPHADTLAAIERLGLNWPVGYIAGYAIAHEDSGRVRTAVEAEIEAVMASDMLTDLKLRIVDRLRSLQGDRDRAELDELLGRAGAPTSPGEETEAGRGSA